MFYFGFKSIEGNSFENREKLLIKLNETFEIKEKKNAILISRDRMIHKLRILRIIIPKLITKVTIEPHRVKYKTRVEGFSFVFLFVLVSVVLMEFKLDRVEYPRDYNPAFPFILLSIFILTGILEVIMIHKKLKTVHSDKKNS